MCWFVFFPLKVQGCIKLCPEFESRVGCCCKLISMQTTIRGGKGMKEIRISRMSLTSWRGLSCSLSNRLITISWYLGDCLATLHSYFFFVPSQLPPSSSPLFALNLYRTTLDPLQSSSDDFSSFMSPFLFYCYPPPPFRLPDLFLLFSFLPFPSLTLPPFHSLPFLPPSLSPSDPLSLPLILPPSPFPHRSL